MVMTVMKSLRAAAGAWREINHTTYTPLRASNAPCLLRAIGDEARGNDNQSMLPTRGNDNNCNESNVIKRCSHGNDRDDNIANRRFT